MNDAGKVPDETCFVAIPYQEPFETIYADVLKDAILAGGLAPTRADSLFRPGDIVHQLISMIRDSQIVVADLTQVNANVYYEIGVAHVLRKPTVLLSSNADVIPFDLRGGRVILYDKDDPFWGERLATSVTSALLSTREAPDEALPAGVTRALAAWWSGRSESTEATSPYHQLELTLSQMQRSLDLATKVRGRAFTTEMLAQQEATNETIRVLLGSGYSRSDIISELVSSGASELWAERAVDSTIASQR